MSDKSAKYVVDLLALAGEHEQLLQTLYETFAEKMPEKKGFWNGIAAVESKHVKIMEMLEEYAHQSKLRMRPESLLTIQDVQHSVDHLKLYLEEVQARGISPRRAAVVAKELEEGILENNFDQQFVIDHAEPEQLLHRLQVDTQGHSAAMDALLVRRDEYSMLVQEGIVSQVEIELARTIAKKEGQPVDAVLVNRFNADKVDILRSVAKHFNLPYREEASFSPIAQDILLPLRERYDDMKSRLYVPVQNGDNELVYVLGNPGDLVLRDEIDTLHSNQNIDFEVAYSEEIIHQIGRLFGVDAADTQASASALINELNQDVIVHDEEENNSEAVTEEDSALVKLVNLIIEEAYQRGASDIHIEPMQYEDTRVRIRVDGMLIPFMGAPARYSRAMISRLKIMAGLDIAERRLPQSGKIQYRRWGRVDTELRLETYPSVNNQEDAVLRILASGTPLSLGEMQLSEANLMALKDILAEPYGLFLCVGPTGSGKTTTLHSALGYINNPDKKIITIEDPVEISQRGIRQVQANKKTGLTFATALRSFLRADPDVIMVGEMRDYETAHTALEASLTGHLVLSTLHTNNARETITRLLDMGLDPFAFADSLVGVLAQRLTRLLCEGCRTPVDKFTDAVERLARQYGNAEEFHQLIANKDKNNLSLPGGCKECNDIGFRGRIALHELLNMDNELREMIMRKSPAQDIRSWGMGHGMRTLRQDGIQKVIAGLTTEDEVVRVCAR